jgi:predicted nucleotidyltransferase component of viral defense system
MKGSRGGAKMLSENSVKEFATKYQTSELNIAREYLQHLFLSGLYSLEGSASLAFKGGTALRIIYGSPRFSEDLDFTSGLKPFSVKGILRRAAALAGREIAGLEEIESKETTGGYLAVYNAQMLSLVLRLELNVSMRKIRGLSTEPHLIASEIFPAYNLVALDPKAMVREKMQALVSRKKPRDIFDLYFILRNRLEIHEVVPFRKEILGILAEFKARQLSDELKVFLPKSYWNLLTDFTSRLNLQVRNL